MAELREEVRRFIVQALACYDAPSVIKAAVKEEFGLTITRQQVQQYDPERAGKKPAKKWCDVHAKTREAFLKEIAKEPVAERAVRLRSIGRMARAAETMGNYGLAKELLEQAAKEVGNAFTNKREITGAGGGPIATQDLTPLTEEERVARAAALLAVAAQRRAAAGTAP